MTTTTHKNPVLTSAYFVSETSQNVKLNKEGIESASNKILDSLIASPYTAASWSTVPLHPIPSLHPPQELLNFIFLVSSLNFSFWSSLPTTSRFGVKYKLGVDGKGGSEGEEKIWTGYWSLLAALHRAKEEGVDVEDPRWYKDATEEEIKRVFRSDQEEEMPLIEDRIRVLREVGTVLCEKFSGQFSTLITQAGKSALKLVSLVVENFSCYDDKATWEGKEVLIRKRAQILVAETWAAFEGKGWGEFHDIGELTMFADYRVPQILHSLSTLTYSPSLVSTLQSQTLFPNKSPLEVEIRALSIVAVEEIRLAIERTIKTRGLEDKVEVPNAVLLDFLLWYQAKRDEEERGGELLECHRTRSIFY